MSAENDSFSQQNISNRNWISKLTYDALDEVDKHEILGAIQEALRNLENDPVKGADIKILTHAVSSIHKLLIDIYEYNDSVQNDQQLDVLEDHVQMALALLDSLGSIVAYLSLCIEEIEICEIKSVVLGIPQCIQITFKHCKESQTVYQTHMKSCVEILELYKKTQEIYINYIDILNTIDNTTMLHIVEAIHNISEITQVLFGMNIKCLVDSWKGYYNIVEKHAQVLVEKKWNCSGSIGILTDQIKSLLDSTLEITESNTAVLNVKLSAFLAKIAIKIMSCLWDYMVDSCYEAIFEFLTTIFSYNSEYLVQKKCNPELMNQVQVCLLRPVEPFIVNFISQPIFLTKLLSNLKLTKNGNKFCRLKILSRIIMGLGNNDLENVSFDLILDCVFENCHNCTIEFYWKPLEGENTLFDDLVLQIVNSITKCNEFYSVKVEQILMNNILDENIWCNLLALNVWIHLLRNASPHVTKRLMTALIEKIDALKISPFARTPKIVHLKLFLQQMYRILPEGEQNDLLNNGSGPANYPHFWRLITEKCDPCSGTAVETLLNSAVDTIQSARTNGCALTDFTDMMENLESISVTYHSYMGSDNPRLTCAIISLWELNIADVKSDNNYLRYFISKLVGMTIPLIKHLNNPQLITILKTLKHFSSGTFCRIVICRFLCYLSAKMIEFTREQNTVNSLISDLFEILLKDTEPILVEYTLEAYQLFVRNNQTIITNNVTRMLGDKQCIVKDYFPKYGEGINVSISTSVIGKFRHQCLVARKPKQGTLGYKLAIPDNAPASKKTLKPLNIEYNLTKKIKLCENVEDDTVTEVLDRIKSEIKCLNKAVVKDKFTVKHAQNIKSIIVQLERYL